MVCGWKESGPMKRTERGRKEWFSRTTQLAATTRFHPATTWAGHEVQLRCLARDLHVSDSVSDFGAGNDESQPNRPRKLRATPLSEGGFSGV
jgi:hypothetical protein